MAKSMLGAIQSRESSDEPCQGSATDFRATDAEPGSREKLEILAKRIRQGLPLWHPEDRHVEDVLLHRLGQTDNPSTCLTVGELLAR